MARPLRIDVEGGWYHITARGIERRAIFCGKSYYCHFIELLEEMSTRSAVEVHAYCLLSNHYHLIIRTPHANASQAIQWLNVSHSAWFNARQGRVGHLFQGRFKSSLIDGNGSWLRLSSEYLHLNPVRTKAMGLGKRDNKIESRGLREPSSQQIKQRLEKLRKYQWSSYGAYAGYAPKPKWLYTGTILKRSGDRKKYRRGVQRHLAQGADAGEFECLGGRVAIGTRTFVEEAKTLIGEATKEQPDRTFLVRRETIERIIKVVEKEKKEKWEAFRNRHGDWGRDLVLYLARKRSGLTLREIGGKIGGVDYKTIGKAVQRLTQRLKNDKRLRVIAQRCLAQMSHVET